MDRPEATYLQYSLLSPTLPLKQYKIAEVLKLHSVAEDSVCVAGFYAVPGIWLTSGMLSTLSVEGREEGVAKGGVGGVVLTLLAASNTLKYNTYRVRKKITV